MTTAKINKPQIVLDDTQAHVVNEVFNDIYGGAPQRSIGGFAGTGKSTIAKAIIMEFVRVGWTIKVLCPTGKAANVQRRKGNQAETIHSEILNYSGKYQDDRGVTQINWNAKALIPDKPDVYLIDEASMVNKYLYDKLMSLNVPIIWIGDHGQLPPVGGDPQVMRYPDFILNTNYRQGNSEIVDYALAVREGRSIETEYDVRQVHKMPWRTLIEQFKPDQAILGFNASRVKYNQLYRKIKGYKGNINVGERIICVHNNRRFGIYNGMQFIVKDIFEENNEWVRCLIAPDYDLTDNKTVKLRKSCFNAVNHSELTEDLDKDEICADYGYGITCHKSQGSEWDKVLVFNQQCKVWDSKRWFYTAATRAAKELVVVG